MRQYLKYDCGSEISICDNKMNVVCSWRGDNYDNKLGAVCSWREDDNKLSVEITAIYDNIWKVSVVNLEITDQ